MNPGTYWLPEYYIPDHKIKVWLWLVVWSFFIWTSDYISFTENKNFKLCLKNQSKTKMSVHNNLLLKCGAKLQACNKHVTNLQLYKPTWRSWMEIAEIIILCINTLNTIKDFFCLKYRIAMYQTSATPFLQFKIFFSCLLNWTFFVWMQKLDFCHNQQKALLAFITLPNLDPRFDLSLGYDRPGSMLMCHGSCCCEHINIVELFPTFIYDSEMGMMAAQSAAKLFCNLVSLIFRSQVRLG